MKTLYVVRHAKSSWSDPDLDDFDRPLNDRGLRNAPEMGTRMANRNIRPDLIISSPAKRALHTARLIANTLGYPEQDVRTDQRLYHASPGEALAVIRETENAISSLMIFGHNPGCTDLVNHLASTDMYNIPTCGIAAIESKTDVWGQFGLEKGTLVYYDFPKNKAVNRE